MRSGLFLFAAVSAVVFGAWSSESGAQAAPMVPVAPASATAPAALALFAVEIKVGPLWDGAKAPREQAFFKEHAANLKTLRDAGHIVIGARYADKGLIVVAAPSMQDVKDWMAQDPSIAAGTFIIEVHAFNVFYPGQVQARPRR